MLRLRRFNFMLLIRESASKAALTPIPIFLRKEGGKRKEGEEKGKRKEERKGERSWGEVTASRALG